MPTKSSIDDLADLLRSLTREIPFQQMRFNYAFLDQVEAFAPLFEKAKAMGFEGLALAIAPRHTVLDESTVETSFRAVTTQEQRTAIRVQPLSIGFTKRYAYSGLVQNRVQVSVRRIAPEPGKTLHENAPE